MYLDEISCTLIKDTLYFSTIIFKNDDNKSTLREKSASSYPASLTNPALLKLIVKNLVLNFVEIVPVSLNGRDLNAPGGRTDVVIILSFL
jgi:hypothetical protein